jgi:HSP20 family molecular chaperone IbpA
MKTGFFIAFAIALAIIQLPVIAWGQTPYGYAYPGSAPGAPPPWASPARSRVAQDMRIERSSDQDNYYLILHLSGIEPQGITVATVGGLWLRISTQDSQEVRHENMARDYSAWERGFSYRSSGNARQIRLPRDADVAALHREDGTKQVRITIPRRRWSR